MAIRNVVKLGHPVLRQKARFLTKEEIRSDEVQDLVDDMIETMHDYDGVGLAAPQVAESINLLVLEVERNPRYPKFPSIPLTVLINIEIVKVSPEIEEDWEGCLSLPDLRGLVDRHEWIEIKALDRHGNVVSGRFEGFIARIIQHENDHLEGRVFIEKMKNFQSLGYADELVAARPEIEEALERAD